jgi:16S rRNA G966 N2-methylase RsmD
MPVGTSEASRAPSTTSSPLSSPYTDLLPRLSDAEFADLKADIAVRGVLVACEFTVDGVLLDGAHRIRAATELNVPYPRVVRAGLNTHALRVGHTIALQAHRRMLTPAARQELIARLRSDGLSVRAIANATGTPRSTVGRALAGVPGGSPERGDVEATVGLDGKTYPRRRRPRPGPAGITVGSQAEQNRAAAALLMMGADVGGRMLTLNRAERLARETRLANARTDVDDEPMPATIDLRFGDFRTVLDVPDGSVDLVLTDPPWTLAAIREHVFADVAATSARLLKPGGHLAIYSGTQHLPQVLAQLEGVKGLEYRWTMAITNGDQTAASARLPRISSRWRPVVIYRKAGDSQATWLPTDIIGGNGRERDLHRWQQGVSEAEELITMLTGPGALVVDACAGSASFGVAAHNTGRRWIGAELNAETFATARARLAQLDGLATPAF